MLGRQCAAFSITLSESKAEFGAIRSKRFNLIWFKISRVKNVAHYLVEFTMNFLRVNRIARTEIKRKVFSLNEPLEIFLVVTFLQLFYTQKISQKLLNIVK